ncbi:MAG: hypothetical protein ABJN11_09520 [Lentilitoribacter sp.]
MKLFKIIIALVFASLFLSAPSYGAAEIGKALIDGKIVILYDDKTWRFEDETEVSSACERLSDRIDFCKGSTPYEQIAPANNELLGQFRKDDRNYAMIIEEEVGSKDGMTLEFMRNAIYENQIAGGVKKEDIIIIDTDEGEEFGQDATFVAMATSLDGLKLVYAYTIMISETTSVQLITYALGQELTDEVVNNHDEFLDLVRIDFE